MTLRHQEPAEERLTPNYAAEVLKRPPTVESLLWPTSPYTWLDSDLIVIESAIGTLISADGLLFALQITQNAPPNGRNFQWQIMDLFRRFLPLYGSISQLSTHMIPLKNYASHFAFSGPQIASKIDTKIERRAWSHNVAF